MTNLKEKLRKSKNTVIVKHFIDIWPVVEATLVSFTNATKLPIFVFLDGEKIFQSEIESMPMFCKVMLGSPDTAYQCVQDGKKRALKQEGEISKGMQMCHAGMVNGRREIETGAGTMVILFGAKKSDNNIALKRRRSVLENLQKDNPSLSAQLEEANVNTESVDAIMTFDTRLMDSISQILQLLLNATVQFHALTINMAHELSVMLLGLGLFAQELESLLKDFQDSPNSTSVLTDLVQTQLHIQTECKLGLYIVRNFLSHTSESRYTDLIRPYFEEINLNPLILDMVNLYQRYAAQKEITIDISELSSLPLIHGSAMELRRMFHNILNNAIKYSYHSVPTAHRTIKIKSNVPYDPGFKQRRFSISIENYGLGLSEEESLKVYKAGFRGEQAVAEVPIGAGIGLSEASKIIKAHKGQIKLRSRELYKDNQGYTTYLTRVDLIFPYTS